MKSSANHLKKTFAYILTLSLILLIYLKLCYLKRLATGDSYRSSGKTFGIAKSTALSLTHDFCEELSSHVAHFIKFPSCRKGSPEAIIKFKEYCSFKILQTVEAINGIHIGIKAPQNDSKVHLFCRKHRYSVNT